MLALLGASGGYAVGARAIRAWFADAAPEAVALAASLPALPLAVILGIVGGLPGRGPRWAGAVSALAVLGAANMGLGLVLWCALVRRAGAETALLVTYLNPPVALVLAALVAGEALSGRGADRARRHSTRGSP